MGIALTTACASTPETSPKELSNQEYRKTDVRNTVVKHKSEVNDCYIKTFASDPKAEGKVVLKFTINSEGQTVNLDPVKESSTLLDPRLINCLRNAIALWKLPPPSEGSDVEVTYPFQFKSYKWADAPDESEK